MLIVYIILFIVLFIIIVKFITSRKNNVGSSYSGSSFIDAARSRGSKLKDCCMRIFKGGA